MGIALQGPVPLSSCVASEGRRSVQLVKSRESVMCWCQRKNPLVTVGTIDMGKNPSESTDPTSESGLGNWVNWTSKNRLNL